MNSSGTIHLERRPDGVFILTMQTDENRFNPNFMKDLHQALDTVEKSEGPCALVVANKDGNKIWSNGLDLDWLASQGIEERGQFLKDYMKLMGRMLVFPVPTVAAINGHAFAGGCIFSFTHDFRVMRKDRGFLCMPEIDLRMPLAPGMNAAIACKMSDLNALKHLILLGKRFTADEALQTKMIDSVATEKEVLATAIKIASQAAAKGEARQTMNDLKYELYKQAYEYLVNGDLGRVVPASVKKSKL
eukprot:CAMPEP_0168566126 /NCGR_PEP_ID=MMETSP0413-20121227/14240_1 /TAXON_ID=136452 /ORGANISM="Filamoeba nolandi, Strain NC-AS-23-1" /LENGTH=245 /DNA_ID=CAMNT_0008598099 /DNA_START=5 /DNA_END=742 /DNA_ORIENTATION=-